MYLPFCEVSWLYKECKDTGDEYFSALVLEFDLDENSDERVPKQLKIFCRQVSLRTYRACKHTSIYSIVGL